MVQKHIEICIEGGAQLPVGETRRFEYERAGEQEEGFLLALPEGLVAYVNRCPHWNVDLDMGSGDFLARRVGKIICRNHGALFDPLSGVCEMGPCFGQSLESLQIRRVNADVWVRVPEAAAPR